MLSVNINWNPGTECFKTVSLGSLVVNVPDPESMVTTIWFCSLIERSRAVLNKETRCEDELDGLIDPRDEKVHSPEVFPK